MYCSSECNISITLHSKGFQPYNTNLLILFKLNFAIFLNTQGNKEWHTLFRESIIFQLIGALKFHQTTPTEIYGKYTCWNFRSSITSF